MQSAENGSFIAHFFESALFSLFSGTFFHEKGHFFQSEEMKSDFLSHIHVITVHFESCSDDIFVFWHDDYHKMRSWDILKVKITLSIKR